MSPNYLHVQVETGEGWRKWFPIHAWREAVAGWTAP
jgi:hypothetical protein